MVRESVVKSAVMPGRNGGTLKRGGAIPGAKPGAGRPPSELREKMRGSLAQRIQIAEQIADNKKSSDADRLRALDFLAKYGLGTTITETDTEGNDAPKPFTFRIDKPGDDSGN